MYTDIVYMYALFIQNFMLVCTHYACVHAYTYTEMIIYEDIGFDITICRD